MNEAAPRRYRFFVPRHASASRLLCELRAVAVTLVLVAAGVTPCWAQSGMPIADYRVKAAFISRFGGFVEWPNQSFPQPDSPIVIGVLGDDAVAEELIQSLAGRTVNGRPASVRKLRRGEALSDLHIVFIGASEGGRLAETLALVRGQPVLTVTESRQASSPAGVINFVQVESKLRFDVALEQAELGQLRISSRLLSLARKVISNPS